MLRGLDLVVRAAETVAILGPNGAGKSTLLRILALVSRPGGGSLRLLGTDCFPERPDPALARGIGFVAHDPLVYLDLTARENLEHCARLYGLRENLPLAALERVGLAHVAERRVRTFSRGMLQRLALARATLHAPRLLLLDEPFSALDDDGRRWLSATLTAERDAGTASIVVSHDLEPLAGLATRCVVLARGAVAADRAGPASPSELAELYRGVSSGSADPGAGRVAGPA